MDATQYSRLRIDTPHHEKTEEFGGTGGGVNINDPDFKQSSNNPYEPCVESRVRSPGAPAGTRRVQRERGRSIAASGLGATRRPGCAARAAPAFYHRFLPSARRLAGSGVGGQRSWPYRTGERHTRAPRLGLERGAFHPTRSAVPPLWRTKCS